MLNCLRMSSQVRPAIRMPPLSPEQTIGQPKRDGLQMILRVSVMPVVAAHGVER